MTTTTSRKLASLLLVAVRYREEVGKRVRALRDERGWTQHELAERVGVQAQTISRWERGGHLGKPENLEKLADAFGMDVGQLMAGIQGLKDAPPLPLRKELDEIRVQLAAIQRALEEGPLGLPGAEDDPADDSNPTGTAKTQAGTQKRRATKANRR